MNSLVLQEGEENTGCLVDPVLPNAVYANVDFSSPGEISLRGHIESTEESIASVLGVLVN